VKNHLPHDLWRRAIAVGLCFVCAGPAGLAQDAGQTQNLSVDPVRPSASVFWRPYIAAEVPEVSLANSSRLRDLIRAGNLYLSARDAVALALENNLDVHIARFNRPSLEWRLERVEAGGALAGVPSGATQSASVASGQGVIGSQQAAGVSAGNTGATRNSNTTVSQVGPVTQTLDPTIQEGTTFSHRTLPQANTRQSIVAALVQGKHDYTASFQEGFLTGGSVSLTYNEHYLNENAPTDILNPSVAPSLAISIQHNLLQGFGIAVNARNITVAKLNLRMSDLNFRTQLEGTVANVLNTYYALAGDYDDLKAKQGALDTAQRFYDESRRRLDLGALAALDVTTALNQTAISRQNLINSQAAVDQQEVQLKNLISRTGTGDPLIAGVRIIPTDHLAIPSTDDLPPVKELVQKALANRSDLLTQAATIKTSEVSALGTENGLLPTVQAFSTLSNAGTAGTRQTVTNPATGSTSTADPYFDGGIGNALGQIFRRNYPSESIGVFARAPIHNRQAQADYGIDQLQLRQQQLGTAKAANQAQVDVMNAVVAIQQSKSRYEAAVQNRILQQQLLDAEQKRFSLGASTSYNVVVQQRDLANAQSSELASLVTYQSARTNLDRTTGATLATSGVSIAEAQSGRISQTSSLPAVQPAP
jgi:outer membrane protein